MEAVFYLASFLCTFEDLEITFHPGDEAARNMFTIIGAADAAFRTHTRSSQSHYGCGFKIITNLDEGMACDSGMFHATSRSSKGLVPLNIACAEVGALVEKLLKTQYTLEGCFRMILVLK